jgi:hypothetical protein
LVTHPASLTLTRLSPEQKCTRCNGLLVPPTLALSFTPVAGADYLCMNCGRPYRWVGNPPKLTLLVVVERARVEDPEDDELP